MPDKKLTDSEIVTALKCCVNEKTCKNCPYSGRSCMTPLKRDTLDLINRLQAENEELVGNIDRLKEENEKQRLVIESVDDNMFPLPFETDYDKAIKTAKAEAYKECIEKVKALFPSDNEPYQYWEIHEGADNLLKELNGE